MWSVEFSLTTPALVAGPDLDTPELRLPSVLGSLRQWWRVGVGWKHATSSDTLRAAEALVFGWSADEKTPVDGQGAFVADFQEISGPEVVKIQQGVARLIEFPGKYGPAASRRFMLAPGGHYRLELQFPRQALRREPAISEGRDTFEWWSLLGSIGHGARRGHGSVQLLAFADDRPETPAVAIGESMADYESRLEAVFLPVKSACDPTSATEKQFPTLTAEARLFVKRYAAGPDGAATLGSFAASLASYGAGLTSPMLASKVLSNQERPNPRFPSPVHVHLHRCSDGIVLAALLLPQERHFDMKARGALLRRIEHFFLTSLGASEII